MKLALEPCSRRAIKLTHAVHETQTERGLVSTYVASAGRARKHDLEGQFRRTDAALDTAIGAVLVRVITVNSGLIITSLNFVTGVASDAE